MAYTIYRQVKVLSVEQRKEKHLLRPKEIVDPVRERGSYTVTVARFSDVDHEATISDFKREIIAGQVVSIAINDKSQVIAVVNHSTGEESSLKTNSLTFGEIGSVVLYAAIPSVLFFFIARKAFQTVKYHDLGWGIIAVGTAIVILIVRGVTRQFLESGTALARLRNA